MSIIHNRGYGYQFDGKRFVFYSNGKPLLTPGGRPVRTLYKPVADRILQDLNRYGYEYHSIESILSWHFTMLDNFSPMGHEKVEQTLIDCFLTKIDWTCQQENGSNWVKLFGEWNDRKDLIKKWLSKATIMQMTAACCIGNAYYSLNLAFVLATIMERSTGKEREKEFRYLAALISNHSEYGPAELALSDFKTFDLYYGIHLEEAGPILKGILSENASKTATGEMKNTTAKTNVVWRDKDGMIACPGDRCPAECDDTCPIWLNTIGLIMAKTNWSAAIRIYEDALKLAPDMPDLWNNMAMCYGYSRQYEKAYDAYKKAYQLGGRKGALYGLALSSRDCGRIDEALIYCEEYKRKFGDDALDAVEQELFIKRGKQPVKAKQPEEHSSLYMDILAEFLKEASNMGYVAAPDILPNIPELFVQADQVCFDLFVLHEDYFKKHPNEQPDPFLDTLGAFMWPAFAGMGAVWFWDKDWDDLQQVGIIKKLVAPEGIEALDDFVLDLVGIGREGEDSLKLRRFLAYLLTVTGKFLAYLLTVTGKYVLDDMKSSREAMKKFLLETHKAMYLLGIIIEMHRLGMD